MARRSHGGSGGGWGSGQSTGGYGQTGGNAAHNPFEVKLPRFLYWLEMNEDHMEENSVIMVDDRDARMVSPFQGWLTKEIMSNCEFDQCPDGARPGDAAQLGVPPYPVRQLHAGRDQSRGGGGARHRDGLHECRVGSTHGRGSLASGFSALCVAPAQGYLSILHGREDLQWQ